MPEFDYTIDVPVRYRDLDPLGHVNNAVYASYMEQARVSYVEDVVGEMSADGGAVVATLDIEFERPIHRGETVTVGVGATDVGTSSIPLGYEIRTEEGLAATGTTLMVTVDEDGEARPIPDSWRAAITEREDLA